MCVINGPVTSVNATKILAIPSNDGTRQFTVYANKVDTAADNAMILPVPFPDSVKFHDLSTYSEIFADLDKCFESTQRLSRRLSNSRSVLAVHRVGSYEASIVPSLDDFDRLSDTFKLSLDVATMLTADYTSIQGSPAGFIVCKLNQGAHDYHPFAYSHNRPCEKLFIPTKHFHSHGSEGTSTSEPDVSIKYSASSFMDPAPVRGRGKGHGMFHSKHGDDWDHIIYTAATELNTHDRDERVFRDTVPVKWNLLPIEFQGAANQTLSRWTFFGHRENADLQPVCLPVLPPAATSASFPSVAVQPMADYIYSFWG